MKLQVQFGSSLRRQMMTVQSDRHTKPVFLGFLLTVFGFGFFQEQPQPTCNAFLMTEFRIGIV